MGFHKFHPLSLFFFFFTKIFHFSFLHFSLFVYLCGDGSRCSRHTPIYLCLHSNMNIRILATGGGIFSTSSICSLRWTRARRNKFCYNNLLSFNKSPLTSRFRGVFIWLSIILTASLCCACTQESLPPREPVTRSIIPADTGAVTLDIDTAWVGEEHINF